MYRILSASVLEVSTALEALEKEYYVDIIRSHVLEEKLVLILWIQRKDES